MSKKVHVGNGTYCYTENCQVHESSVHTLNRKVEEARAAGNVTEFLRLKEQADAQQGTKPGTITQDAIISAFPTPKPAPPAPQPDKPFVPAHMSDQMKVQAIRKAVRDDIKSYIPNSIARDGSGIVAFHKDIGFPFYLSKPKAPVRLDYTQHAREEAARDAYGAIKVYDRIDLNETELIEVKYNQKTGQVDRFLVRMQADEDNDVCLVVQPRRDGTWRVITNWLNMRGDGHFSLNESRYSKPHSRQSIMEASGLVSRKASA